MRVDCLKSIIEGLRMMGSKISKRFLQSAVIFQLMMALALSSCETVLQYPEEPEPLEPGADVYLNVNVVENFELLGEYEYDFNSNEANIIKYSKPLQAAQAKHQARFTLRAYRSDDKMAHPTPVFSKVFTQPVSSSLSQIFKLHLPPGDYRLVMWIDYVDIDSYLDKYYNTSDFSEIILNNNGGHYGSNDYRDAFYGETTVHVPENISEDLYADIGCVRPMAKYVFISDDFREFYNNELTRLRSVESELPANLPKLSDYTVRVIYTRYMTCAFNAFTGKPADSRTGVEYRSLISMLDADRAQLAFDYIFTNGTQTSVNVAMEVLYKDGSVVSRMPAFDVPLKRSHRTIITGKFLTTKSGGAIGISPDYDGSFNIEIH